MHKFTEADGSRLVTLKTLELAQFRPANLRIPGEYMEIKWFKGDVEQVQLITLKEICRIKLFAFVKSMKPSKS